VNNNKGSKLNHKLKLRYADIERASQLRTNFVINAYCSAKPRAEMITKNINIPLD